MQEKLLIIDDDESHQQETRKALDRVCCVVPAYTLAQANAELSKSSFSLILLSVALSDGNAFSFFAKLKSQEHTSEIPVIFVTLGGGLAHELMGFSLGADDYISKPIDPSRLKARIDARLALLRKRQQREMVLVKGNVKLSVNHQRAAIVHEGREMVVSLTPVEFKLLFHLLRFEDRVFSREQLLVSIWENAAEVFDRTVDMHVGRLCSKIALSEFEIKPVHGLGYKLSKQKPANA
jgi:DNA-binding response OmpR family regulator